MILTTIIENRDHTFQVLAADEDSEIVRVSSPFFSRINAEQLASIAETEVCPICLGSGVMSVMAPVYAGEPHMADVGSRQCVCQSNENDGYDEVSE